MEVHRGSDGPLEKEIALGRAAQVPDFGLFYNMFDDNTRRRLPLIIEIKPYRFGIPVDICKNMIVQTLVQARHVFDCYGYNKRDGCKTLHVLCVAGKHFFMYRIGIQSLDFLPEYRDESLLDEKRLEFVDNIKLKVKVAEVINGNGTDYSTAFKQAWTGFTQNCGLGLSVPQWPVA